MKTKKDIIVKSGKARKEKSAVSKRLSKCGEWMRAHPKGLDIEYINWQAVLR